MDPVTALLVISAGTTVVKAGMEANAADEKLKALDLTKEQHVLAHQQKTLANFDTMEKLLQHQVAQATVRGVGLGSPSLEAIQRNTVNIAAKEQSNLDIEENIFEQNIATEKANVNNTLFAELFGDVASTASEFAGVKSKLPSRLGT